MQYVSKKEKPTCCSISKQCRMQHWDEENNRHVLIWSQQCKTLHLNVSGPNNVKADYANWGYRGHCNLTMAPSWLDCVCVCVYVCMCVSAQTIPLGFYFPPQMPFPKPSIPWSFFWGLIMEAAAVNRKVKGHGRGSDWSIPPSRINQLAFSFPPIGYQLESKQWTERKKECQKELG